MHELRGAPEPTLDDLVARVTPVDLLLVEGFKHHPHPKIEVHRPSLGKPLLYPDDPHVVAIASDEPLAGPLPLLPLGDPAAVAHFILDHLGLDHFGLGPWRS
jgi:molybdopterin-guanine dinucleotide biosynthesis protein B